MTDIEQKALEMISAARKEHPTPDNYLIARTALCRAIEQHEAFRQEVSDAVEFVVDPNHPSNRELVKFIIPKPKPDPLLAALLELELSSDLQEGQHDAKWIRNKLDELGFEIREKNDD